MAPFRDIKRKMRRDVHDRMNVPALYIAQPGDDGVLVHVRLHTKFDALTMDSMDNLGLVARRESKPKIIFMRDELAAEGLTLARNAIVSVEPGEAYALDNADAPDDITVTYFVTVVEGDELADLPVPGESDG